MWWPAVFRGRSNGTKVKKEGRVSRVLSTFPIRKKKTLTRSGSRSKLSLKDASTPSKKKRSLKKKKRRSLSLKKKNRASHSRRVSHVSVSRSLHSVCSPTAVDSEIHDETKDSVSDQVADPYVMNIDVIKRQPIVKSNFKLPPQDPEDYGKLTVMLDMDETLLHSELIPEGSDLSSLIDVHSREDCFLTESAYGGHFLVHLRPFVCPFLEYASKHFEVCIFTAAAASYAGPVLDILDPNGYIKHRLFREDTERICDKKYSVKPLDNLGRDLSRTVLVDNSLVSMMACPDNAILIPDFIDNPEDVQLKHLAQVLTHLDTADDVRDFLIDKFAIRDRLHCCGLLNADGTYALQKTKEQPETISMPTGH